jgi:hypothetical protein
MDTPQIFEILIRRKIPIVSSFLFWLLVLHFVVLFIFYVIMYPASISKSSSEMQTAYYILVVPKSLKILSSYLSIGLLIVVPLYYRARLHKPAILLFEEKSLLITGKKISINIPKQHIRKVYCNDLKNAFGEPKEILQVVIRQNTHNITTFRLKHFEQGGELIDALSTLDNVEFTSYQNEMVNDHQ